MVHPEKILAMLPKNKQISRNSLNFKNVWLESRKIPTTERKLESKLQGLNTTSQSAVTIGLKKKPKDLFQLSKSSELKTWIWKAWWSLARTQRTTETLRGEILSISCFGKVFKRKQLSGRKGRQIFRFKSDLSLLWI